MGTSVFREAEPTMMRRVRIENIGCSTTTESLTQVLGLSGTPFLEGKCSIEMFDKNGNYHAIANVPHLVANEILRGGPWIHNGRPLNLQLVTETNSVSEEAEPTVEPATYAQTAGQMDTEGMEEVERKCVELDMSFSYTCYDVKDLKTSMVAQAVSQSFPFDESKILYPMNWDKILWTLDTKHPELYENVTHLKHNGKDVGRVTVKVEKQFKLPNGDFIRKKVKVKNELLITLRKANTDSFRMVKEEELYRKIVAMGVGTIKKGITVQYNEGSDVPNGNLLFVLKDLKPGDKTKLPDFFTFGSEKMFLHWAGKWKERGRFCSFCKSNHDGMCEKEKMVRTLENERDAVLKENGGNFKMKIFSNSTLRHANQGALACNIDAMSGATTGNLLNAVEIDKEVKEVPNVVMVCGQSEVSSHVSKEEFFWTMRKKRERLQELSKSKKVAVLPLPEPKGYIDADKQARLEAWTANLQSVADTVKIWDNPIEQYENDDGTHPSEKQTGEILAYINTKCREVFGADLLLPSASSELICSNRMYRGVNALYKYGCAACPRKERNRWPGVCDACKEEMNNCETLKEELKAFDKRVQELNELNNPSLSDGEETSCNECGEKVSNALEITKHFRDHHSDKDAPRTPDEIRSCAKFTEKGRRSLSKSVPEKSLTS